MKTYHRFTRKEALGAFFAMLFSCGAAQAETVAQSRKASFLRMATLEKLTVGPSDNFQGVTTSDEKTLFFTQNRNMASVLQVASLASLSDRGRDRGLLSETFDSRDPAPSPDGTMIAFTSFQKNARGQICVATVAKGDVRCLSTAKRGASQPQWLNGKSIAYLEKTDDVNLQNLVQISLESEKKTTLFSENVLAFAVHPDKNTIVYVSNGGNTQKPVLKWRTLAEASAGSELSFELPGLSGFPRFDTQGQFLYFIQFFNDTNNDGEIDGNDNAVPFRVPWVAAKQRDTELIPEQLISSEYNCSYPAPAPKNLVVTCNFEDTLDVYRMPLAGILPPSWTEAQLLSAHASARSIAERVLLLNTLRFRFAKKYNTPEVVERLLANHVVAGEFDASMYYVDVLSQKRPEMKNLLAALKVYLDVSRRAQRETASAPSPALVEWLSETRKRLAKAPRTELTALVDSLCDLTLRKTSVAWKTWEAINPKEFTAPLALFLYSEIGKRVLAASPNPSQARLQLEWTLASHPLFDEEAQVNHALTYVRLLEANITADKARLQKLETLLPQTADESVLNAFLKEESAAIEMIMASTPAEEKPIILKLTKGLNAAKARYFLKRGLNVRLFTLFSARNKEQAVNLVASRWVSETKLGDAEYVYAREQYLLSRLDKAYAYLNDQKVSFSGDIFYGAIRVTDDAEAHLGFLDTRLRQNKGAELDAEYLDLAQKGFIAENASLARAWRSLNSAADSDKELIQKSLVELESVLAADGYNPSVAWFLLGVAHHKMLLASRHKLEFDRERSMSAHHAYLVAADLARGNKRLLASIYANLGQVHMVTRSYGQAATFYTQRLRIPFVSRDDQVLTLWRAARALFAANDAPSALKRMEEALDIINLTQYAKYRRAFLEHAAFYAVDAQDWQKAVKHYQEFQKADGKASARNELKAQMGLAWSLGKLSRSQDATQAALTVLERAKATDADTDKEKLVRFQPQRYQALAYAVLAANAGDATKAAEWRQKRINLMLGWEQNLDAYSLKKSDWRSFLQRECNHRARQLASDANAAIKAWSECFDLLNKNYKVADDTLDPALFFTAQNALVTAMATGKQAGHGLHAQLKAFEPEYIKALKEAAPGNNVATLRWLRQALTWNGYQAVTGEITATEESERRAKLIDNPLIRALREEDAEMMATLPGRAKILEPLK